MSETLAFLKIKFVKNGEPIGESRVERFFRQIQISALDFGVSSQPDGKGKSAGDEAAAAPDAAKAGKPGAAAAALARPGAPSSRMELMRKQLEQRLKGEPPAPAAQRRKGSGNRTLAAAKMGSVGFSKRFDASSAAFLNALNSEDTIDLATFTIVQRDPKNPGQLQDLLIITVRRAVIESIDLKVSSGSGAGVEVTEEIKLRSDRDGFGFQMKYISPTTNASSAADYGRS